jgi:hypothetical protein
MREMRPFLAEEYWSRLQAPILSLPWHMELPPLLLE